MIEVYSLIFCCLVGTIGHFLYKLSNKNKLIGFLFSVNESTWEHIKLGVTPITLFSVFELIIFKNPNIIVNCFFKIIIFISSLIFLYYTYQYIIKKNILIIDITIFYLSLAFSHLICAKLINNDYSLLLYVISIIFYTLLIFAYKNFSKNPPNNFIFQD